MWHMLRSDASVATRIRGGYVSLPSFVWYRLWQGEPPEVTVRGRNTSGYRVALVGAYVLEDCNVARSLCCVIALYHDYIVT